MKLSRTRALVILVPLLLAAACGASNAVVNHDSDPTASFTSLRGYRWLPQGEGGFLDARVRSAINTQLVGKGYDPQPRVPPDFFVTYHVVARDRVEVRDWGYTRGRFGRSASVQQYTEGTLIVDIVDARTMRLVWRGTARGELDPDAPAGDRERRLKDAVARLLAPFPSRASY
jgi:hypothetical protein